MEVRLAILHFGGNNGLGRSRVVISVTGDGPQICRHPDSSANATIEVRLAQAVLAIEKGAAT
jgi:hypothetical protein